MLTGGNLPSFSAPSKAHSSQLLLPHSHPRRLSESSCTETTCSFSTVCITLPQKRDKVNRNSSCLIRFLQKSLRLSCQLFYTTPTFFIPHQRSAAPVSAAASVGAGRSPPGSSTRGGSRDQVLLPLPKNRRKHWVFAGFPVVFRLNKKNPTSSSRKPVFLVQLLRKSEKALRPCNKPALGKSYL